MTNMLRDPTKRHVPGYNLPMHPFVYNISGVEALREQVGGGWTVVCVMYKKPHDLHCGVSLLLQYGDWFSYNKTARAQIFDRDVGKIVDEASFQKLMRVRWAALVLITHRLCWAALVL